MVTTTKRAEAQTSKHAPAKRLAKTAAQKRAGEADPAKTLATASQLADTLDSIGAGDAASAIRANVAAAK